MTVHPNIILFDGICNLCNGVVCFLIKRDKKAIFRFAAIQSETGQNLQKQFTINNDNQSIIYIRKGKYYQQSTAVLYIFKDLKRGWELLFPLITIPAFIRNYLYLIISRNRYRWFGKKETCMLPNKEIRDRFV
ncbi:thiol-disulfide oxidoreductase DCC family protein [Parabacteroides provencensis]|uniref:thiol-disulfide oxidoreductase DCC family protein n=1 Tax=Parabacteroides provencensis TaxID=1944636 RepID=UPI000C15B346|nr:DCC1-like thiol-disulfide oxidoreductase family protein [Parabacteroides provencensis]